ncbi:RHS repeat domain-containing protein, partial [Nostoc sp. NIES-2111]
MTYDASTSKDTIRVLGHGAGVTELDPRANSGSIATVVQWKTISFGATKPSNPNDVWNGIFYHCRPDIWDGSASLPVCVVTYSLRTVEKITLPVQSPSLFYEFLYTDDSAPQNLQSRAEIREIRLPDQNPGSAAKIAYTWKQKEVNGNGGGWSPLSWFDAVDNPLESKTVSYYEQDGSTSVLKTQTWNYNFGLNVSEITAPTGQKTKHYFTARGTTGNWRKGLIDKTVSIPNGGSESAAATTWKCWAQNEPWLGVNALEDPRNAFVRAEYRKLGDGSNKMSLRVMGQDKNGNEISAREYDWLTAPSGGASPSCTSLPSSVFRETRKRYWNPAGGSGSPAAWNAAPVKTLANAYWSDSAFQTRNSVLESRVVGSFSVDGQGQETSAPVVAAATQFSYDNADTNGLPRFVYRWDSVKSPIAPVVPTNAITLGPGSAAVQERSYVSAGTTRILSWSRDENNNTTNYSYGDLGSSGCSQFSDLYPTAISAPEGQVRALKYDCATGLLKEEKFTANGNLTNTFNYDIFGRETERVEASNEGNGAKKRKTVTEYDDLNRTVRVVTDRAAFNDQALATVSHFNQLGELFLERQTDDTGGAISASGTAGVKQIRMSRMELGGMVTVASNPHRVSSEDTMGWTRILHDSEGRPIEEAHYKGSSVPWGGGTTNLTGKTTRAYSGETTTVTDAAGAVSVQVSDALGRLASVRQAGQTETDAAKYQYDFLDNLKEVEQRDSVQHPGQLVKRVFTYSTLGRLVSTVQPESGLTAYEYFDNGALKKRTDARGASVTFAVDGLSRVTS